MPAISGPILSTLLAFAQAAAVAPAPVKETRLRSCLEEARTDPSTAIITASAWTSEASGEAASLPQQCLGFAYMSLLRWEAAEQAFVAARDARPQDDQPARARLGAMAGNAALAGDSFARAVELLGTAQVDAEAAGLSELAGQVAADRARALVGTGREAEAGEVLAGAQILSPQAAEVWLLSATLERRNGDLSRARGFIATAASLAPQDPEIGLEAGLISALTGQDEAAREAWQSVLSLAPDSPHADTARTYLARLDGQTEQTP